MELLKQPNLIINNPDAIVLDLLKEKYLGKTISIYYGKHPNGVIAEPLLQKDGFHCIELIGVISKIDSKDEWGGGRIYSFTVDTGDNKYEIDFI